MFKTSKAFSSFSVDDLKKAKKFYGDTLGLSVKEYKEMGHLQISLSGGGVVMIYPKGKDHKPATFTVLNFPVTNIDKVVDGLLKKGVKMEKYKGFGQDEKGIARSEKGKDPNIAWFKDPAGNIISVLQES